MKLGTIFLLFSSAVYAQDSSKLIEYLSLSPDQVAKLASNIKDYSTWLDGKERRIVSLREEISYETGRDTPDPGELGWRYAEIELTCRALVEEQKQLQARNAAVLNAAQQAKLKGLQDALRLSPVIAQAQSASLLPSGGSNADFTAIYDPAARLFAPSRTACDGGIPGNFSAFRP
ncbi:MAG: hypothetical protein IT165_04100 [Bryobacterales bacterium]|nr:hypothetical protein [Bryobacterales bacterium]